MWGHVRGASIMLEQFREIAAVFQCPGTYLGEEPYGSGHINDTYKVCHDLDGQQVHYLRQRVNHKIFKDVSGLMDNIGRVTRHQRKKFEEAGETGSDRRVLTLIPTVDGRDCHRDPDGNFWRTYVFIEGATVWSATITNKKAILL